MSRMAREQTVWQVCQDAGVVLVTGNRAGDVDSLDETIHQFSSANSLPVVTIADAQRVLRDPIYAATAALRLLDYLERIESLRGTGRLFIP